MWPQIALESWAHPLWYLHSCALQSLSWCIAQFLLLLDKDNACFSLLSACPVVPLPVLPSAAHLCVEQPWVSGPWNAAVKEGAGLGHGAPSSSASDSSSPRGRWSSSGELSELQHRDTGMVSRNLISFLSTKLNNVAVAGIWCVNGHLWVSVSWKIEIRLPLFSYTSSAHRNTSKC